MAGQIRVAYVSGLLGALSAYGGAFPHLLQRVGLRPEDFADPDRFVDLEKYIDPRPLPSDPMTRTRCPDEE